MGSLNETGLREEKARLRREILARRAGIANRAEKDAAIARALRQFPLYRQAEKLLFYVSLPEETDTRALLAEALAAGREVYAPVCLDSRGMVFCRIAGMEDLKPGRFGVLEPEFDPAKMWKQSPDPSDSLCLVPGMAFDGFGHRLGYGKGYYDRFLSENEIVTVGLCRGELLLPRLPTDSHDRRVAFLARETGVFPCADAPGKEEL